MTETAELFSVLFCPGCCSETLVSEFRDGAESCGRHWDMLVPRLDFAGHLPEPRWPHQTAPSMRIQRLGRKSIATFRVPDGSLGGLQRRLLSQTLRRGLWQSGRHMKDRPPAGSFLRSDVTYRNDHHRFFPNNTTQIRESKVNVS